MLRSLISGPIWIQAAPGYRSGVGKAQPVVPLESCGRYYYLERSTTALAGCTMTTKTKSGHYIAEHVRRRLRFHIRSSGRRANVIAREAGIAQSQMSAILTGRRANPSIETIGRILAALGLGWSALDPWSPT